MLQAFRDMGRIQAKSNLIIFEVTKVSEQKKAPLAVLVHEIEQFCLQSKGLRFQRVPSDQIVLQQRLDNKSLPFSIHIIEDVLHRWDAQGRKFLQVNCVNGMKWLMTDELIGFKPLRASEEVVESLPRVVTTPDLVNVLQLMEETATQDQPGQDWFSLRKIYESILSGAEAVGFDMSTEKHLLRRFALDVRQTNN